jgi:pyruvate formate lyase activating enzyme
MIIGGIQKTSLIDYPGKICTVLFTRGCNFSCGFCHNPELVVPKLYTKSIPLYQIFNFLKKRKDKIEGITITGGEPTLHSDLPQFISKIKNMKYSIKLDTNGTNPQIIKKLINDQLIDYLAMDIKNSPNKYSLTVQKKINFQNIKKSIEIIKKSPIQYEFRTTIIPRLHDQKSITQIGKLLHLSKNFYLQQFRPSKHINSSFSKIKPYSYKELLLFKKILSKFIKNVSIRGTN